MSKQQVPVAWLGADRCAHNRTGHEACATCAPPYVDARREHEQYREPIHPDIAKLLGIEGGVLMLVRQIKLFVADKPVLTAISFIPDELAGEPGDGWKGVAVDSLAAAGGHTLTSWGYTTTLNGLPATPDCIKHGYPLDAELPVTLNAKPFKVWIEHRKEHSRPAGLILLVGGIERA